MKIKTYIIATILSLLALGAALVFSNVSNAQLSGGGGTIGQLEQWRSLGGYLVPRDANLGLKVPGLATSTTGCLSVASGGIITANGSACGSGSGTSFFTNSGSNTYLNTGTNLQAPTFQATSTTATSTFNGNLLTIGYVQLATTTTAMLNRMIVVDGITYPKTRAGIQAAIDSLPANGGTVLLPEGRYYLDGTINIKKHGVTLKGESFVSTFADQANQQGSLYGASVLLAATTTDFVASTFPAGQPLIKVGELGTSKMWTGGGVYNLVLEGTRGVTVAGNGIEIYNVQAFRVENNGITQVAKGVHVEADQAGGISNVQIEKNIIYYNDGIGIFFGPGSQEVFARNNYITVATGYGIYTGDGSVTITGNHIESMVASSTLTYGGTGIYLTASKAYVNDNDIMNAKYHCLYIGASHEKVTDNYFNNCNEDAHTDGSGIYISGTLTDVNVSGNSIHDYDSKMRYGIYDNTSGAPTIGFNTITGATVAKVYSPNNLQADNYLLSKLGVGTTSPTSQLSVVSTGNAVAATAPTNSIYYAGYTGALKYFHILLKNSDHIELQSFEGKDITIQEQGNKVAIGGTTRNNTLTVNGTADVTGKFGIGTSSPYAALSVVGSTGVVAEKYNATGTTATSTFAGGLTAAGTGLAVLQNGKVGIGTLSPTALLDVYGSYPAFRVRNYESYQYSGAGFYLTNTAASMGNQAGTAFYSGINDGSATQGYFAIDKTNTTGGGTGHEMLFDYNADDISMYTNNAVGARLYHPNTQGTIFEITPPTSPNNQEATLATVLKDGSGNNEWVDWTTENYGSDHQSSINVAKSGTGQLLPFSLRFWNSDLGPVATNSIQSMTWLPSGKVGIGVSTSTLGALNGVGFYVGTTSTSSFAWDINIAAGHCIQYNGSCISLTGGTSGATTTWRSIVQAWIYPGETTCQADEEYKDGRQIHTLKPEYIALNNNGTHAIDTVAVSGCNGYSVNNAQDVASSSAEQFFTISGNATGFAALMGSASLQASLIATSTAYATSTGFTGVEIDIEGYGSWSAADTLTYYTFLTNFANTLHANGKKLMVDLPPIWNSAANTDSGTGDEWDSANSTGYYNLTYQAMNATPVDYFVIMAYDYHFDYGGGASIQPLKWVGDIVAFAKKKIPDTNRIVIGMPAYGYQATTAGYDITNQTYGLMTLETGFGTAVRDGASGEMKWTNGGQSYVYNDSVSLDIKRTYIESLGISRVSVWHLGDNLWFTSPEESGGKMEMGNLPQVVREATTTLQSLALGGTSTPSAQFEIKGLMSIIGRIFTSTGTKVMEILDSGIVTLLGTWDFSGASVKQHKYPSFSWPAGATNATTTTATTTIPLGTAYVANTYNSVECWTGAATTTYQITDGTNKSNTLTATTSVSRYSFSSNNTFVASERRFIDVGPLTASYISCSFDVTEN